jgi:hypothetical protein
MHQPCVGTHLGEETRLDLRDGEGVLDYVGEFDAGVKGGTEERVEEVNGNGNGNGFVVEVERHDSAGEAGTLKQG